MDLWRERMPDGEIRSCLLNGSSNFPWLKHIRIRNGNDAIFFDLRNREETGRTSNQNDSADQCPFFPVFPLHPQSSRIAAAIIRTSFIRCSIGTNSSSPCILLSVPGIVHPNATPFFKLWTYVPPPMARHSPF